ncbi:YobA family protein [Mesobacillus subterraneus]|uniref:DUF3221 domain-containing protein n=1 Tax=Mesobacillus subterraneus TaxID=285983 RepID=UPI00203B99AC|nr:DUF3221 domain-containing protein [Mesobacillus subterraneus]MCM3666555.1 YobA family protein [Mesobacillus subterraneus]MCM3685923.1 YobA family protein [Mesobacillus subterraneus]
MRAIKFFFLIIIVLLVSLGGCAKAQDSGEGFILEVNDHSILVAQNISLAKYNELKDVSSKALIDQGGLELIWLTYGTTDEFQKGDHVVFWIDGGVRESYPEQADAKKVERK